MCTNNGEKSKQILRTKIESNLLATGFIIRVRWVRRRHKRSMKFNGRHTLLPLNKWKFQANTRVVCNHNSSSDGTTNAAHFKQCLQFKIGPVASAAVAAASCNFLGRSFFLAQKYCINISIPHGSLRPSYPNVAAMRTEIINAVNARAYLSRWLVECVYECSGYVLRAI